MPTIIDTSNRYHLALYQVNSDEIETHITTDSFNEFNKKRSELITKLKPGQQLHCYQSNDEHTQFNLSIIEGDPDGLPFFWVTRGTKEFKDYNTMFTVVMDQDWLGVFESKLEAKRNTVAE